MKKIFKNNKNIVIALVAIVAGLVGGAFASAPLYRIFCQVTGFGGTTATQKTAGSSGADITPAAIKNFHSLSVFFDKTIANNTPIKVDIMTKKVDTLVNQTHKVVYRVENLTDKPLVITSSYNATPAKYAHDIVKTQCFCFVKQHLEPHEKKDMAVVFFISPEIINAEGAKNIRELTVGYHFYMAKEETTAQDNSKHLQNAQ